MSTLFTQSLQAAEMFPDVPFEAIQKAVEDHKGDLEKVAEELLSYEMLKHPKRSELVPSDLTLKSPEPKVNHTKPNIKSAKSDPCLSVLSSLLSCSLDRVKAKYQKTKDIKKTVREIIQLGWSLTDSQLASKYSKQLAVISESKQTNPYLNNIEKRFYLDCLEYFGGDVHRTIQLATWMLNPNSSPQSVSTLKPLPSTSPSSMSLGRPPDPLQEIIDGALKTNKLDLHGLLVSEAQHCVQQVLKFWWRYEMEQRIIEGTNLRGKKAIYVGNLDIITGRGFHSSGGVPKLRNLVHRILNSENYIFEDIVLGFKVMGKKT
ncbi:hypothetical protein KL938_000552 [Ogataea parapolymorpha]|nr:hypothetical protein KL938_000552 [Ogataea parapolymorpha]